MKKNKRKLANKKIDKELKKIFKEKTKNKKRTQNENDETKSFTTTSYVDDIYSETNEQTLVLPVNSSETRKIKRQNNHKRRKDEHKDMKNTDNNIIEVKNIKKYYLTNKKEAIVVLNDLSLKIERGDFVVLFGKSGSGKSTLLNIISGLDRATEGNVIVKDKNLPYLSNSELTKFRRENVSFIFQQYHLLNNITGYENVETGMILQKDKNNRIDINQMFKDFELEEVIHKYPSQMSGGQQQRVSILRAIAKNSEIIFADEPTGALDKKTSDIVMNLLQKINKEQGKTIIMVSHDPDVVRYAKRTIVLSKGKIVSDERIVNL